MEELTKVVKLEVNARSFYHKAHGSSVPKRESGKKSQEGPSRSVKISTWLEKAF